MIEVEVIISRLTDKAMVGAFEVLNKLPYQTSVKCTSKKSEIYQINWENFDHYISNFPGTSEKVNHIARLIKENDDRHQKENLVRLLQY